MDSCNKLAISLMKSFVDDNPPETEIEAEWTKAFVEGDFEVILKSDLANTVFNGLPIDPMDMKTELRNRLENILKNGDGSTEQEQLGVLFLGITCLTAFIRVNWTGPAFAFNLWSTISPESETLVTDDIKRKLLVALSVDGEEVYPLVEQPLYMYIAMIILVEGRHLLSKIATSVWWAARCVFTLQKTLDDDTNSLYNKALNYYEEVLKSVTSLDNDVFMDRDILTKVHLEKGLIYHHYGDEKKALASFKQAQEASSLTWELSGALGKRTRFQTFETTQLLLKASSNNTTTEAVAANGNIDEEKNALIPKELELNDDQLLEKVTFTKDTGEQNLKIIDQCILLAFCLNIKKSNPSSDELTKEEMRAFVLRVLEHPNNWLVHTMGLLLRSRLEGSRSRTVERGAMQLQVLLDQYDDTDAPFKIRIAFFHCISIPSRWQLKRELGERFLNIGALRSALELFESLELWEDVVTCYRGQEQHKKAEEIVVRQLAKQETPKLWCILGDIRNEEESYLKSWELSNHRYSRAQRSLGRLYFVKNELDKAVESLSLALKINPIFPNTWFLLGCCEIRRENYEKALSAFQRVVSFEPEDSEAWNNIATVFIKLGRKMDAFQALKEALKQSNHNWKMWENFLFVCVDIGQFSEAIFAFHRLMDLREKYVDVEILSYLITAVTKNLQDADGVGSINHKGSLERLMERISSMVSNIPELWEAYATYYDALGNFEEGLECRLKLYRSLQIHGWESSVDSFMAVAKAALAIVSTYKQKGDPKSLSSGRLLLRNLIKKSEENFKEHTLYKELNQALEQFTQPKQE